MRKALLLFFATFLTISLYAQGDCNGCDANDFDKDTYHNDSQRDQIQQRQVRLNVYPNPATDFIAINDEDATVKQVVVYNLIGRQMRQFNASADSKYLISDLPKGMYLIQLLDINSKVITTQRISKR